MKIETQKTGKQTKPATMKMVMIIVSFCHVILFLRFLFLKGTRGARARTRWLSMVCLRAKKFFRRELFLKTGHHNILLTFSPKSFL